MTKSTWPPTLIAHPPKPKLAVVSANRRLVYWSTSLMLAVSMTLDLASDAWVKSATARSGWDWTATIFFILWTAQTAWLWHRATGPRSGG